MKLTKSTIIKLIKEELQGLQEQSKSALRKQVNAACFKGRITSAALTALRRTKKCPASAMTYKEFVAGRRAAKKGDAAAVNKLIAKTPRALGRPTVTGATDRPETGEAGPIFGLPKGTSTQRRSEERIAKQWKYDQQLSAEVNYVNLFKLWNNLSDDRMRGKMVQKLGRTHARLKSRGYCPRPSSDTVPAKLNNLCDMLQKFIWGKDTRDWIANYKKNNPGYDPHPGTGRQASGGMSPSAGQQQQQQLAGERAKLKKCVLDGWAALKKKNPNVRIDDVKAELMAKCEKQAGLGK